MDFIKLSNIHKTFGKNDSMVHALKGVSMNVEQGEMVAIMGKSGSGKCDRIIEIVDGDNSN